MTRSNKKCRTCRRPTKGHVGPTGRLCSNVPLASQSLTSTSLSSGSSEGHRVTAPPATATEHVEETGSRRQEGLVVTEASEARASRARPVVSYEELDVDISAVQEVPDPSAVQRACEYDLSSGLGAMGIDVEQFRGSFVTPLVAGGLVAQPSNRQTQSWVASVPTISVAPAPSPLYNAPPLTIHGERESQRRNMIPPSVHGPSSPIVQARSYPVSPPTHPLVWSHAPQSYLLANPPSTVLMANQPQRPVPVYSSVQSQVPVYSTPPTQVYSDPLVSSGPNRYAPPLDPFLPPRINSGAHNVPVSHVAAPPPPPARTAGAGSYGYVQHAPLVLPPSRPGAEGRSCFVVRSEAVPSERRREDIDPRAERVLQETGVEFVDPRDATAAIRGDFVLLEKFLSSSYTDSDELKPCVDLSGNIQIKSIKSKKTIVSISKWTEAWLVYMMIMSKFYGVDVGIEMTKYSLFMIGNAQKYKLANCLAYDWRHRQRLAQSKSLAFSAVDYDFFITTLDCSAVKVQRCSRCFGVDHSVSDCPMRGVRSGNARSRPRGAEGPSSRTRDEVCVNFQSNKCKWGNNCFRKHECSGCGGPEPKASCSRPNCSKVSGQNPSFSTST